MSHWMSRSQCEQLLSPCCVFSFFMPRDLLCMFWSDGRRASAHCSFVHAFRQWAEILGANGTVTLDDFVLPKSSHEVGCMWFPCCSDRWNTFESVLFAATFFAIVIFAPGFFLCCLSFSPCLHASQLCGHRHRHHPSHLRAPGIELLSATT